MFDLLVQIERDRFARIRGAGQEGEVLRRERKRNFVDDRRRRGGAARQCYQRGRGRNQRGWPRQSRTGSLSRKDDAAAKEAVRCSR